MFSLVNKSTHLKPGLDF